MNTNPDIASLLALAEAYASARNLALSSVSLYAARNGALLPRLRAGADGLTIRRRDAIVQWFSDHWPTDLDWPHGIPRPLKNAAGAA
ncbi:hypothetical protein DES42_104117 [Zavarzinia compransoris]|nr:hypothetical protein DES42_104117 [Zavarzinia compransoris]